MAVQPFQPFTLDNTIEGLKRARNAMRERLWADLGFAHKWLCHDDMVCPDGCEGYSRAPNYEARLELYYSDIEK